MNKKILNQLDNLGIIDRIYCSDEETAQLIKTKRKNLPDDVFYDEKNDYWRYDTASLPEIDLKTKILLKSANDIMIIKYCAVFFVVLSVISILVYLIANR